MAPLVGYDDENYENDENNVFSESMASLLGYMPTSLHNTTLYEIVADNDKVFASSSSY